MTKERAQEESAVMLDTDTALCALCVWYLQHGHFERDVVHFFWASDELQTVQRVEVCLQGKLLLPELRQISDTSLHFSLLVSFSNNKSVKTT